MGTNANVAGRLMADVVVTGARIRSPQVGSHHPHPHCCHFWICLPLPTPYPQ